MFSAKENIYFAAVGDVHGHIYAMLDLLKKWEYEHSQSLAFILQVGDFEPHRNPIDLTTMDAPSKHKKLGDFPDFYENKSQFPYPIWFIGGNHEPYGYLDLFPNGREIIPNCHYLGRVNLVEIAELKIVGLSGIYKEDIFEKKTRSSIKEIDFRSNSDYISFIESEIIQAMDYGQTDILLLHEWPSDIITPSHLKYFEQYYFSNKYEKIGNEYSRLLLETLSPQLVLCGHLHKKYRNKIFLPSGRLSNICCLANVNQGKESIAVFRLAPDKQIIEVTN